MSWFRLFRGCSRLMFKLSALTFLFGIFWSFCENITSIKSHGRSHSSTNQSRSLIRFSGIQILCSRDTQIENLNVCLTEELQVNQNLKKQKREAKYITEVQKVQSMLTAVTWLVDAASSWMMSANRQRLCFFYSSSSDQTVWIPTGWWLIDRVDREYRVNTE